MSAEESDELEGYLRIYFTQRMGDVEEESGFTVSAPLEWIRKHAPGLLVGVRTLQRRVEEQEAK